MYVSTYVFVNNGESDKPKSVVTLELSVTLSSIVGRFDYKT